MKNKILNIDEASKLLQQGKTTVYEMCRDGRLAGAKIAYGKWAIPRSSVATILRQGNARGVGKQGSPPPAPAELSDATDKMVTFTGVVQLAGETIQQFTERFQKASDALAVPPSPTKGARAAKDSADANLPAPDTKGRDSGSVPSTSEPLELSSIEPLELHPHDGKSLRDRYRPMRFSEIVGNETAVEMLQLYAKDRRLENFLITGPSGTGKTSLAWVYARSIACKDREEGTFEPCGRCEECMILEKHSLGQTQFFSAVSEVNVGSYNKSEEAAKEILSEINMSQSPVVIINEADRLLIKQAQLFAELDSKATKAVFFTSTDLSKFDDQLIGRCKLLSTRRLTRPEMLAYVMGVCKAEGGKMSAEEANDFLEGVGAPRNGQIRDVLKELGGFLLRKEAQI
ncbi:MAG: helix-turn-helix domain-containing protein [bacterium]